MNVFLEELILPMEQCSGNILLEFKTYLNTLGPTIKDVEILIYDAQYLSKRSLTTDDYRLLENLICLQRRALTVGKKELVNLSKELFITSNNIDDIYNFYLRILAHKQSRGFTEIILLGYKKLSSNFNIVIALI
jgi:hypothetical protein